MTFNNIDKVRIVNILHPEHDSQDGQRVPSVVVVGQSRVEVRTVARLVVDQVHLHWSPELEESF